MNQPIEDRLVHCAAFSRSDSFVCVVGVTNDVQSAVETRYELFSPFLVLGDFALGRRQSPAYAVLLGTQLIKGHSARIVRAEQHVSFIGECGDRTLGCLDPFVSIRQHHVEVLQDLLPDTGNLLVGQFASAPVFFDQFLDTRDGHRAEIAV